MAGSGFVVSKDGDWLLTNAHVVRGCQLIRVGGEDIASRTVIDEGNDLALVKVDDPIGKPLPISAPSRASARTSWRSAIPCARSSRTR